MFQPDIVNSALALRLSNILLLSSGPGVTSTNAPPAPMLQRCAPHSMKQILLIITLLISNNLKSQYRLDAQVKTEFEAFISKEPKDVREKQFLDTTLGFGIIYSIKEDTLNILDLIPNVPSKSITVKDLKSARKTGITQKYFLQKSHPWVFSSSTLHNDTLEIQFGAGFMAGFGFTIKVHEGTLKAEYFEYSMQDSIYLDDANKEKTSDIHIVANLQTFVLSDSVTSVSNDVYGKTILDIPSFYQRDSNFKGGYIQKKQELGCLFRLRMNNLTTDK
jgi:hypothetical protein